MKKINEDIGSFEEFEQLVASSLTDLVEEIQECFIYNNF